MTATALPPRHAKFVDEYLIDGNGTQAAIRAGYSANGARVAAHRLLTNAAISSLLVARRTADATRLSITRESVLQRLLEAYEMAREKREPAAMVAAAREISKLQGYYSAVKVKARVDVTDSATAARFERLSDEELNRIIIQAGVGTI